MKGEAGDSAIPCENGWMYSPILYRSFFGSSSTRVLPVSSVERIALVDLMHQQRAEGVDCFPRPFRVTRIPWSCKGLGGGGLLTVDRFAMCVLKTWGVGDSACERWHRVCQQRRACRSSCYNSLVEAWRVLVLTQRGAQTTANRRAFCVPDCVHFLLSRLKPVVELGSSSVRALKYTQVASIVWVLPITSEISNVDG